MFFENEFHSVHEQLCEEDRKPKVLQLLLDYVLKKDLMVTILAWAETKNSGKFQQLQLMTPCMGKAGRGKEPMSNDIQILIDSDTFIGWMLEKDAH